MYPKHSIKEADCQSAEERSWEEKRGRLLLIGKDKSKEEEAYAKDKIRSI